jgi:hypothetical protein
MRRIRFGVILITSATLACTFPDVSREMGEKPAEQVDVCVGWRSWRSEEKWNFLAPKMEGVGQSTQASLAKAGATRRQLEDFSACWFAARLDLERAIDQACASAKASLTPHEFGELGASVGRVCVEKYAKDAEDLCIPWHSMGSEERQDYVSSRMEAVAQASRPALVKMKMTDPQIEAFSACWIASQADYHQSIDDACSSPGRSLTPEQFTELGVSLSVDCFEKALRSPQELCGFWRASSPEQRRDYLVQLMTIAEDSVRNTLAKEGCIDTKLSAYSACWLSSRPAYERSVNETCSLPGGSLTWQEVGRLTSRLAAGCMFKVLPCR